MTNKDASAEDAMSAYAGVAVTNERIKALQEADAEIEAHKEELKRGGLSTSQEANLKTKIEEKTSQIKQNLRITKETADETTRKLGGLH